MTPDPFLVRGLGLGMRLSVTSKPRAWLARLGEAVVYTITSLRQLANALRWLEVRSLRITVMGQRNSVQDRVQHCIPESTIPEKAKIQTFVKTLTSLSRLRPVTQLKKQKPKSRTRRESHQTSNVSSLMTRWPHSL